MNLFGYRSLHPYTTHPTASIALQYPEESRTDSTTFRPRPIACFWSPRRCDHTAETRNSTLGRSSRGQNDGGYRLYLLRRKPQPFLTIVSSCSQSHCLPRASQSPAALICSPDTGAPHGKTQCRGQHKRRNAQLFPPFRTQSNRSTVLGYLVESTVPPIWRY